MILGVFIHAANIYSVDSRWIVSDPGKSYFYNIVVDIIHAFRMPAFFWMSGYFCALTYAKSASVGLLKKRIPRIAIPLLSTWLLVNGAQVCYFAIQKGASSCAVVLNGVPLFHLWFLLDLLIFNLIAALMLPWASRYVNKIRFLNHGRALLVLVLVALSYGLLLLVRATGVAYEVPYDLTSLFRLATNLPFFLGGILMYVRSDIKNTFLAISTWLLPVALVLSLLSKPFLQSTNPWIAEVALLSGVLLKWIIVGSLLNMITVALAKKNWLVDFLSDASYTIFIFHHTIIACLGLFLLNFDFYHWQKFLIVVFATFMFSSVLHVWLVARFSFFRLLFNGRV